MIQLDSGIDDSDANASIAHESVAPGLFGCRAKLIGCAAGSGGGAVVAVHAPQAAVCV